MASVYDDFANAQQRFERIIDQATAIVEGDEGKAVTLPSGEQINTFKESLRQLGLAADAVLDQVNDSASEIYQQAQQVAAFLESAQIAATSASGDADRADSARDSTFVNANVYETVAEGLNSQDLQFHVVTGEQITRYRNESGAAVPVAQFPSSLLVNNITRSVGYAFAPERTQNFSVRTDRESIETLQDGLKPSGGDSYIGWFDVSDIAQIEVTGSLEYRRYWVFYDENLSRVAILGPGDATIDVPENAKWAARDTSTYGDDEPEAFRVRFLAKNGVADSVAELKRASGVPLSPVLMSYGAAVYTSGTNFSSLKDALAIGRDRGFFGWYDVSNIAYIKVKNAAPDIDWPWVFLNESFNVVGNRGPGNGVFDVPEGSKWAARTAKIIGFEENADIEIRFESTSEVASRTTVLEKEAFDTGAELNRISGLVDRASLSANKVSLDQPPVTPNQFGGSTQHERIEQAVDFIRRRGYGVLELGEDTESTPTTRTWIRESSLLLPSNCWLLLQDATLKLADGTFDNIVRNDGIVPNPDPFRPSETINENRNIKIIGMGDSWIEGPDVPYSAPHPVNGGEARPWTGDYYGWRTVGILFANVKEYEIYGFGMRKTTCWAISQENGCEDFEVHDLVFDTEVKNGDGIDFRLGCRNGRVYNISGHTSDDMIALTALKSVGRTWPDKQYVYPMQVGGNSGQNFTPDIEDIKIWNVRGHGNQHGIRLLCGGGSKLQRISVDDIGDEDDGFSKRIVIVGTGYGVPASMGDINSISFNGIYSSFTSEALKLEGPIQDSQFNLIRQSVTSGELYNDNIATLDNTTITNAEFV